MSSFRPLKDGACTNLFKNLCVNSLNGDLSNATTFNPPLFSLVNPFMTNFSAIGTAKMPMQTYGMTPLSAKSTSMDSAFKSLNEKKIRDEKFITYDIVEGGVVAAGQEVREEVHHDETLSLSL
jgi:hypothetical protein